MGTARDEDVEGHAAVILEGEVLKAEELKGTTETVVCLVGAVGAQVAVVVEEEAEALEDEVLAVYGLALEAVVDVAEAEGEVYDGVGGIEGAGAEEVI